MNHQGSRKWGTEQGVEGGGRFRVGKGRRRCLFGRLRMGGGGVLGVNHSTQVPAVAPRLGKEWSQDAKQKRGKKGVVGDRWISLECFCVLF